MEMLETRNSLPVDGLNLPVESLFGEYKAAPEQSLANILQHKKAIGQQLNRLTVDELRMFGYKDLADEREKKEAEDLARQASQVAQDVQELDDATMEENVEQTRRELARKARRDTTPEMTRAAEEAVLKARMREVSRENAQLAKDREELHIEKQKLVVAGGMLEGAAALLGGGGEASRVDGSGSRNPPIVGGVSSRLDDGDSLSTQQLKNPLLGKGVTSLELPMGSNAMEGVTSTGDTGENIRKRALSSPESPVEPKSTGTGHPDKKSKSGSSSKESKSGSS
ncbi:hypothetical protein BGX29_001334, partial [Mortierella sp. GBA35]